MLILFPFFFQKFWEVDWLENLSLSFKEYHDTFLKKERGCLKINLRWPLLFHFRLKSFVFFQKEEFTSLFLKILSIQTVFSLP